MKQVYPWLKKSRPLPFPLENCSFPRSDNCRISEKKSPLSEKEVGPWPFSLGDILVSGPTEHLFCERTYRVQTFQSERKKSLLRKRNGLRYFLAQSKTTLIQSNGFISFNFSFVLNPKIWSYECKKGEFHPYCYFENFPFLSKYFLI